MKRIHNYIKNSLKNYHGKDKEDILNDLTELLTEKVNDLVDSGMSIDDAIDKTVYESGSISDLLPDVNTFKLSKSYLADFLFSVGVFSIVTVLLLLIQILFLTPADITHVWLIPVTLSAFYPMTMLYRYFKQRSNEH
jgi:hypothetical protein